MNIPVRYLRTAHHRAWLRALGASQRADSPGRSEFAALTRTSGGWQFQVREPDGDHFTNFTATADAYAKIRRDGNVVNGYLSPTGHEGTWRLVGNASFQWSREVQAGLVASFGSAVPGHGADIEIGGQPANQPE